MSNTGEFVLYGKYDRAALVAHLLENHLPVFGDVTISYYPPGYAKVTINDPSLWNSLFTAQMAWLPNGTGHV
ncbi:MAG: hypothetical protein LCH99_24240 [Proteobacteria bacterium]|nr:hypothetical protein [Pseudomonadota bacterium]